MLKAIVKVKGRDLLILGLTKENLERLPRDQPIVVNTRELGYEGHEIVLMGGEDQQSMLRDLERGLGVSFPVPLREPEPGETIVFRSGQ